MAHEGQTADDVKDAADLDGGKTDVVAGGVELGEAAEAAEDDGAAVEGGEEVFVDEAA